MSCSCARITVRVRLRIAAVAITLAALALPAGSARAQGSESARGMARFEQGDYSGARAEFETVLRQNGRDANALYHLGRIALQQDRSGDAVGLLEKAIAVDDDVADYHLWLGAALGEEAGRASKFRQPFLARRVKTELQRAIALDPRSATARYGLVQFYAVAPGVMGGSIDKARQQTAELARINPLVGHLASAFLSMRQKDTVGAIRSYEGAITAAPDSAVGYLSLGGLYVRTERWNDAFATFDRLLARHPGDMSAQFQVGRTAALSGQRLDRGERALRSWLAAPPKNAPSATVAGAHHRLGQILERTGHADAARREYEEALRINPRNDDARKSFAALK